MRIFNQHHLKASTLIEILVTMIIAGIIIIAIYDGLNILSKGISRIINDRSGNDIYSHSIIESITENADSSIIIGNNIILFQAGHASDTLVINNGNIEHKRKGHTEKLFENALLCNILTAPDQSSVLSIHVIDNAKDTVILSYEL